MDTAPALSPSLTRRAFVAVAAAAIPATLLTACAGKGDGFDLAEGTRRLLRISSQRAFARLSRGTGLYDGASERAAQRALQRVAPMLMQAIAALPLANALDIVRGDAEAATAALRQATDTAVRAALSRDLGEQNADAGRLADALYAAIGAEEAAIRADPSRAGDSLILGIFSIF